MTSYAQTQSKCTHWKERSILSGRLLRGCLVASTVIMAGAGCVASPSTEANTRTTETVRPANPQPPDLVERSADLTRLGGAIAAPDSCPAAATVDLNQGSTVEYARRSVITSDRSAALVILSGCTIAPGELSASAFELNDDRTQLKRLGRRVSIRFDGALNAAPQVGFVLDPGPGHAVVEVREGTTRLLAADVRTGPSSIEIVPIAG